MDHISFPVVEYKNMTTEGVPPKFRRCFYVEVHQIPRMLREYCTSDCDGYDVYEAEYEQAASIMYARPRELHLLMRPITMHVSRIAYDNRSGKVSLALEKTGIDGICIGSAVLDAILTHRDDPDINRDMYIEIEVFSGLTEDDLNELKRSRKFA